VSCAPHCCGAPLERPRVRSLDWQIRHGWDADTAIVNHFCSHRARRKQPPTTHDRGPAATSAGRYRSPSRNGQPSDAATSATASADPSSRRTTPPPDGAATSSRISTLWTIAQQRCTAPNPRKGSIGRSGRTTRQRSLSRTIHGHAGARPRRRAPRGTLSSLPTLGQWSGRAMWSRDRPRRRLVIGVVLAVIAGGCGVQAHSHTRARVQVNRQDDPIVARVDGVAFITQPGLRVSAHVPLELWVTRCHV
jgi:hypothetical protein